MTVNVETMAYARETGVPWHGAGQSVEGASTSKEMIVRSGLNWQVKTKPLFYEADDGLFHPVNSHVATVRDSDGRVLGVPTSGYQPFQNFEGFDFLDSLLADGIMKYETAGALDGGRRVWALGRLEEDVWVAGEEYLRYMLIGMGHDGTFSIHITPTDVRVVCQNTFNMAIMSAKHRESKTFFRIKHNRTMRENLQHAKEALMFSTETSRRMEEFLARSAERELSSAGELTVIDELFGAPGEDRTEREVAGRNKFKSILEQEQNLNGLTAYSMIQTITGYADHVIKYNGKRDLNFDENQNIKAQRRFAGSLIEGRGVQFKKQGLHILEEMGVK